MPPWSNRARADGVRARHNIVSNSRDWRRWFNNLKSLLCDRAGSLSATSNRDGRKCERDVIGVERFLDQGVSLAANNELLPWLGHHLHPDLDGEVAELLHTLHLQGLEDVRFELWIGQQFLADLLDDLLNLVEVGVVGDSDHQLIDHPVAAHVLHSAQFPERHSERWSVLVPQLDGA